MPREKETIVLSYNGVDGYCSAAMALLRFPKARIVLTSAAKIGRTFDKLKNQENAIADIHVCGLGVYCDWEEVVNPALELKKRGTVVYWYCGRGYMDRWRGKLEEFCLPVLVKGTATNTEALYRHFGLQDLLWAGKLVDIAAADPNLKPGEIPQNIADWRDLILSAISSYLKYQDEEAGPETIRKLTILELKQEEREAIKRYRKYSDQHIIRGGSERMKELRRLIARCADVDEAVLLTGESGTGKEYAAQLIHERSRRAGEHFRAVNCGIFAGNPGLANSTLFGHVKGAFTGAAADRKGAFLSADSGTLFLDEISLLPIEVQGKLLRVLEEGVVLPEGSDNPTKIDVRIIAATNRDLPWMIRKGQFLPDLYHRINTLRIELPPLKAHLEDLPSIAREKIIELKKEGYDLKLTGKDYQCMAAYDWPGNVRQFFKLLKRVAYLEISIEAAIEEERGQGRLEYGAEENGERVSLSLNSVDEIKNFEEVKKDYFIRAWKLCGKNYALTAKKLGVAVNTLRKYVDLS